MTQYLNNTLPEIKVSTPIFLKNVYSEFTYIKTDLTNQGPKSLEIAEEM